MYIAYMYIAYVYLLILQVHVFKFQTSERFKIFFYP